MTQSIAREWMIRFSPAALVAVVTVVATVAAFPVQLLPDVEVQLTQALDGRYDDWHPPIMAVVWSWLIRLTDTTGSLLVLHQFLYGLGFALFADACHRSGRHSTGWLVALLACFPLFLYFNRWLVKDVGMAASLVAATGIQFWFLSSNRRMPWWAVGGSLACLAYGTLLRSNAIFAVGPLILMWVPRFRRISVTSAVAGSVLLSAMALLLSDFVNHRVLHASREDVMQQLQIFDLMGIAARSGDAGVWRDSTVPLKDIQTCYSSIWWDNFSGWGSCRWLRPAIKHTNGKTQLPEVVESRGEMWLAAIVRHPLAYLEHRATHFNSSIYFWVPSYHTRHKDPFDALGGEPDVDSLKLKTRLDYLKRSFLVWPVAWLTIGACALCLIGRRPVTVVSQFSRALILSGLLYSLAYLVIGVATSDRYHYWSTMAVAIGCVVDLKTIAGPLLQRSVRGVFAVILFLCIVIAGYAARLTDVPVP